ncbi:hypothetical protein HHK36_000241 [Tetracentron sinense]|uniref:KIB1-4 beta-propeller domain-containing protein n=1 Tax=Tetracentron sinense TaxID=13715 RepID=A0A834ZRK9_TETSI|nr:hypothetical protein HHK36_000241 [Tetracentron sinense]
MSNWSELPNDLLGLIAKRVIIYEDFVAFGGVCNSWRSVAVRQNFTPSPQLPWLMLPEQKNSNNRAFFSLSKGMVHERPLPEARGKRCWGSQGWLVTFSIDFNISPLNPFTGLQIQLPPHRTFKHHYVTSEEDEFGYTPTLLQEVYIKKAIVSSSPSSSSDYVVMVIHGPNIQLAFARPGDDAWTTIEKTRPGSYFDVIFYKEKFYAVNSLGDVVVYDVQGPNPTELQIIAKLPDFDSNIYLVESSGELLVVSRLFTVNECLGRSIQLRYSGIWQVMQVNGNLATFDRLYRSSRLNCGGGIQMVLHECIVTQLKGTHVGCNVDIASVQAHGSDAMVDEENCVFFLPHHPRSQICEPPFFLFMKGTVIDDYDYVFSENGFVAHKDGKAYWRPDLIEKFTWELATFIKILLPKSVLQASISVLEEQLNHLLREVKVCYFMDHADRIDADTFVLSLILVGYHPATYELEKGCTTFPIP